MHSSVVTDRPYAAYDPRASLTAHASFLAAHQHHSVESQGFSFPNAPTASYYAGYGVIPHFPQQFHSPLTSGLHHLGYFEPAAHQSSAQLQAPVTCKWKIVEQGNRSCDLVFHDMHELVNHVTRDHVGGLDQTDHTCHWEECSHTTCSSPDIISTSPVHHHDELKDLGSIEPFPFTLPTSSPKHRSSLNTESRVNDVISGVKATNNPSVDQQAWWLNNQSSCLDYNQGSSDPSHYYHPYSLQQTVQQPFSTFAPVAGF